MLDGSKSWLFVSIYLSYSPNCESVLTFFFSFFPLKKKFYFCPNSRNVEMPRQIWLFQTKQTKRKRSKKKEPVFETVACGKWKKFYVFLTRIRSSINKKSYYVFYYWTVATKNQNEMQICEMVLERSIRNVRSFHLFIRWIWHFICTALGKHKRHISHWNFCMRMPKPTLIHCIHRVHSPHS